MMSDRPIDQLEGELQWLLQQATAGDAQAREDLLALIGETTSLAERYDSEMREHNL